MKLRILILVLATLSFGAVGKLTFIYQTTDEYLLGEIWRARNWKDFAVVCGDDAMAAYFAGMEAAYSSQYTSLGLTIPDQWRKPSEK